MWINLLVPAPHRLNESCPVCADKLPSNINNIYCSASAVVKAAVRRLRKVRLLLDIQPSHEVKRLRSTMAFVLNPSCSCPPLDNRKFINLLIEAFAYSFNYFNLFLNFVLAGSLALLIHFGNSEFAKHSHSRHILDQQISIYGLPPIGGVPNEITDARTTCASQKNITSLNLPIAG